MDYVIILNFLLFIFTKWLISHMRYIKAKRSGVILNIWANPLSFIDILLLCFIIYIFTDAAENTLDKSYLAPVMFIVYILIHILLDSKLIVSENGIYFRSYYTQWENIEAIEILSDSKISVHGEEFLFSKYKIRNLHQQEKFLSAVEDRCTIKESVQ